MWINDNMWKLVVLCLIALPGCLGQVYLAVDISQSRAHVGETVTMVCRVENMPSEGFIYWFKRVTGPEGDIVDLMASTTQPLPPYDRFKRFAFSESSSGSTRIYTMTLTNTTEEDSGHFGCSYREYEDNLYETEMFDVYSGVDDIIITADNVNVTDRDGINTASNRPTYIEVIVGYTVPSPVVHIYVGDQKITGEFAQNPETHVYCAGEMGTKACPVHYLLSRKVWQNYTFDGKYDQDVFTVTTEVPGSGFEMVNRTVPLIIDHAPMFKCATEQFARRGNNFTLMCETHSRPTPERYFWILGEEYLSPGEYDDHWKAYASVTHLNEQEDRVSLLLYEVGDMQYTEYQLMVGNEYDNSTLTIKLAEDLSPIAEPSSGSILTSCSTLLFTAILLCMHYD